jgi:hypothetical protein
MSKRLTPPATDASQWFDYGQPSDRSWNYGGKDARLRVIPVVRKNVQSNPNGVYVNPTSSGKGGEGDAKLTPNPPSATFSA